MSFVPSVPHIVGDDDDSNEVAEMSKSPETTNQTSDSSEHTDSSSEGGADDEGCSSSSSSAEEEEEDWSSNISYIVATPPRETEQMKDPIDDETLVESTDVVESVPEETTTQEVTVDQSSAIEHTEYISESELSVPKERNFLVNEKNILEQPESPVQETKTELLNEDCEAEPAMETPINSPKVKIISNVIIKHATTPIQTIKNLSPMPRRRSLRSANRSSQVKYAASPKQMNRGRPRISKDNKRLSPDISAGRVRKRISFITMKSPSSNKTVLKAKPLEVTKYFSEVSAILVSERVNEMPFLSLCDRINRLVAEALSKTKMQSDFNQNDSSP